jgi:hypothetical protein
MTVQRVDAYAHIDLTDVEADDVLRARAYGFVEYVCRPLPRYHGFFPMVSSYVVRRRASPRSRDPFPTMVAFYVNGRRAFTQEVYGGYSIVSMNPAPLALTATLVPAGSYPRSRPSPDDPCIERTFLRIDPGALDDSAPLAARLTWWLRHRITTRLRRCKLGIAYLFQRTRGGSNYLR